MKRFTTIAIIFFFHFYSLAQIKSTDTTIIHSENLKLKALLWRPAGNEKFPAIIFCHGSYGSHDSAYYAIQQVSILGDLFAQHGYIFLGIFRRDVGLSRGQGKNVADLMANAYRTQGQKARNIIQLKQMETDELNDVLAGLNFLKTLTYVDTNHLAVIGHSFGGSLSLLVAEHEPVLKAAVVFSGAGYSWDLSPQLRNRLFTATKKISMPVMFIHAENDYSIHPGVSLDSMLAQLHKPHILKIYPAFGKTNEEAHNLIFLNTNIWETDVINFLDRNVKNGRKD